jgi:hypothetical protein
MKMRTQKTFVFLLLLAFLFADYVSVSESAPNFGSLGKAFSSSQFDSLKKYLASHPNLADNIKKYTSGGNDRLDVILKKLEKNGCFDSKDFKPSTTKQQLITALLNAYRRLKNHSCSLN